MYVDLFVFLFICIHLSFQLIYIDTVLMKFFNFVKFTVSKKEKKNIKTYKQNK